MKYRASWVLALVCLACSNEGPPGPTGDCGGGAEACAVFDLVNDARSDNGVAAYTWNDELGLAAQRHAEDMAQNDYFDHVSQDGRTFGQRATEAGYDASPYGENIAAGQTSPEQVMDSWMGSDGHRMNILSPDANEIGVGFSQNLWVQVFGRR